MYGTETDPHSETICNLRVLVKNGNVAPEITKVLPLRVEERVGPGTVVEAFQDNKWQPATLGEMELVTDKDKDLEFIWSLPQDASNNVYRPDGSSQIFTIFSCSGLLVIENAEIKYEELASDGHKILLTIQVTDSGGLSDTAEFTIDVIDVNDPPKCANDEVTHQVSEVAAAALAIGDPLTDLCKDPEGRPLKFLITGSTNNNVFDMVEATGQLRVANAGVMNYEGQDRVYAMTVIVEDDQGLQDTINVNVVVVDANDPPTLLTKKINIAESAVSGDTTNPTLSIEDEDSADYTFSCEVTKVWEVIAEGVVGESGGLSGLNGMALDGKWGSDERVLLEWGQSDTGDWDFWLQFTPASNIFVAQTTTTQLVTLQDVETNSHTLSGWIDGASPAFCIAAAGNAQIQSVMGDCH